MCQVQHEECWEISHQNNRRQFAVQHDQPCETFEGSVRDFLWFCLHMWSVTGRLSAICLNKQSKMCVVCVICQNSHCVRSNRSIILVWESHDTPSKPKTTVCTLTTHPSLSCHFWSRLLLFCALPQKHQNSALSFEKQIFWWHKLKWKERMWKCEGPSLANGSGYLVCRKF